MLFDNPRRDGQTQARAPLLGGEERVKKPLLNLRRNALARIRDG